MNGNGTKVKPYIATIAVITTIVLAMTAWFSSSLAEVNRDVQNNSERLSATEVGVDSINARLDRIENKLDRALER